MAEISETTVDFNKLREILEANSNKRQLHDAIVNAPFKLFPLEINLMFLGIIVLLLVNPHTDTIDRVALSATELAQGTKNMSVKRFEDIRIPVGHHENLIAKAIDTNKPQSTTDWKYLFTPELSAQDARFNQAGGGIAYSAIYPLLIRDGGALIFSYYQYPEKLNGQQKKFMSSYSQLVNEMLGRPTAA